MKKRLLVFIGIFLLCLFVLLLIRGEEDTWLCVDGEWIKHGAPSSDMPTEPCGEDTSEDENEHADIVVLSPKPNDEISATISIEGKAKGTWFFEADMPIKVLNDEGVELAVSYVQTKENWMTEDFVTFSGRIEFISPLEPGVGQLVFLKANPADLPEFDDQFIVPLIFTGK